MTRWYDCHCGAHHPLEFHGIKVWGVCPERIRPGAVGWHNTMGCASDHCAFCGAQAPAGTPVTHTD